MKKKLKKNSINLLSLGLMARFQTNPFMTIMYFCIFRAVANGTSVMVGIWSLFLAE